GAMLDQLLLARRFGKNGTTITAMGGAVGTLLPPGNFPGFAVQRGKEAAADAVAVDNDERFVNDRGTAVAMFGVKRPGLSLPDDGRGESDGRHPQGARVEEGDEDPLAVAGGRGGGVIVLGVPGHEAAGVNGLGPELLARIAIETDQRLGLRLLVSGGDEDAVG